MESKVTIQLTRDQLSAILDYIDMAGDHDVMLTDLSRSAKIVLEEAYNQEVLNDRI